MNEPINPYAAPVEANEAPIHDSERIDFEFVVEKHDIARVLSRPWALTALVMFVAFAFGMSLIVMIGEEPGDRPGPILVIMVLQVVAFVLGVFGWSRFGPGLGASLSVRDPSIIGRLSGHLTGDAFHFQREHSSGVHWLKYMTVLRTNRRGLLVTFDSFRARLFVIPREAFLPGGFEAAVERLTQQFKTVEPMALTGFDPRQLTMPEQPMLLPSAEGAMPYEGELFFSDLKKTRLSAQMAAGKMLLLLLAAGTGIGGALIIAWEGPIEKFFSLPFVGASGFFFYLWNRVRQETRSDQLVGVSKGVVDQQGVVDCTNIGQVRYGWWMFQWCAVHDDLVLLRTKGMVQYYIVLVKREFATDEHWDQAVKLIQQNVVKK